MAENMETIPIPPDTTGEPHKGKYVAYYRVSTLKQGKSGLGIDAQREAVQRFLNGGKWKLLHEFIEVESGSVQVRPQLEKAKEMCLKHDATLIVAKLDRLYRDVSFTDQFLKSKVKFLCCDMPEANEFTIHILSAVAVHERKMTAERTKAALARLKASGKKLGAPPEALREAGINGNQLKQYLAEQYAVEVVLPVIVELREVGLTTLRQLADGLMKRGIKTRPLKNNGKMQEGKINWSAQTVANVLKYEK
jgi:DNA invertase Pin-like site-specific DNA recombinase